MVAHIQSRRLPARYRLAPLQRRYAGKTPEQVRLVMDEYAINAERDGAVRLVDIVVHDDSPLQFVCACR